MKVRLMCIVALMIVPAILFAAGEGDDTTASAQGPVELRWIGINEKVTEDALGLIEFNKALNVKIIPEPILFNNREQMNLLLAGGDLPDHMLLYLWGMDQFWEEGADIGGRSKGNHAHLYEAAGTDSRSQLANFVVHGRSEYFQSHSPREL